MSGAIIYTAFIANNKAISDAQGNMGLMHSITYLHSRIALPYVCQQDDKLWRQNE